MSTPLTTDHLRELAEIIEGRHIEALPQAVRNLARSIDRKAGVCSCGHTMSMHELCGDDDVEPFRWLCLAGDCTCADGKAHQ